MEAPKIKRKPGRPRKTAIAVPLPAVVEAVMPVVLPVVEEPAVEIVIDEPPALEDCPESPARPSTPVGPVGEPSVPETPVFITGPTGPVEPELPPFEHHQPPEPPLRWPNHLSVGELRTEITKYATICGGRMKQLIDEWDRRFPLRR